MQFPHTNLCGYLETGLLSWLWRWLRICCGLFLFGLMSERLIGLRSLRLEWRFFFRQQLCVVVWLLTPFEVPFGIDWCWDS